MSKKKTKLRVILGDILVAVGISGMIAGINVFSTAIAFIIGGIFLAVFGFLLSMEDEK